MNVEARRAQRAAYHSQHRARLGGASTRPRTQPRVDVAPEVVALYRACALARITMPVLCELAGVHRSVPDKWKRGITGPTYRVLDKLQAALEAHQQQRAA